VAALPAAENGYRFGVLEFVKRWNDCEDRLGSLMVMGCGW